MLPFEDNYIVSLGISVAALRANHTKASLSKYPWLGLMLSLYTSIVKLPFLGCIPISISHKMKAPTITFTEYFSELPLHWFLYLQARKRSLRRLSSEGLSSWHIALDQHCLIPVFPFGVIVANCIPSLRYGNILLEIFSGNQWEPLLWPCLWQLHEQHRCHFHVWLDKEAFLGRLRPIKGLCDQQGSLRVHL